MKAQHCNVFKPNVFKSNVFKQPIFLLLLIILTTIFSPQTLANNQLGSSNKTKNIIGHPPFMQSIGAYLSLSTQTLYDENQLPVLTVGSELFVPSLFCQASSSESELPKQTQSNNLDNRFFMFVDQDNDLCLSEKHETQLAWFALDSGQQEWGNIQAWSDVSATLINDEMHLIPAGTLPQSPYTQGLRIPDSAIGKRIGFTYSPVSETGNPNMGNPIKVWDIGYFFGQEKYDSAGYPTPENAGQRLEPIALHASFGEVVKSFAKPKIENLIMKGTFLQNFQLTAEYDFIDNSADENASEDVSRFWWGEAGTTEAEAYFQNPVYQTTNQSPVLTIEDIAKVYSVSILPIKKESTENASYYVVGDIVSTTSGNPNNQFTQPSNIVNLQFSGALNIETTVSATYVFEKGDPNAEDHSEYTWSYIDATGQSHVLAKDSVVESGKVPNSPKLTLEQSGLTLTLDMLPKDQFNRIGDPITISSRIETAQLIAEPKAVTFTLGDTDSSAVTVMAEYNIGRKDVTATGTWASNDETVATVDNQGNVSLNPNLSNDATGSVTFSYLGKTVTIDVIVDALPPSISNLQFKSLLENDELPLFESQGAIYDFHDGGKLNSIDRTTYTWKVLNDLNSQIGSGTVSNSGIIPFPTSSSAIFYSGKVVVLEVTPNDNFNRIGEIQTIEAKLEEIKDIEVEPSPLEIQRNTSQHLNVYALFTGGRKQIRPVGNLAFDGQWSSSAGVSISYSGYVTAGPNLTTGIITYTYLDFIVEIPFTVVD